MKNTSVYGIHGAVIRVESEFPRLCSELELDFGGYPPGGGRPEGLVHVVRRDDLEGLIPEYAVRRYASYEVTVFSLGERKFIQDGNSGYVIVIPSPGRREIFCYARRYSHKLFCTIRNLVKYMVVSILEDKGVHYIHGAAVSRGNKAAVICAKAGSGKTRSLLSISGGGYGILTDDVVLMNEEGGIMPFIIRGNVDRSHLEAFPKVKSAIEKRGIRVVWKWNFWFIHLTDFFKPEKRNLKPHFIVRLARWNSTKTRVEKADKNQLLAHLMEDYKEFGSGVYFKSGRDRGGVFGFYAKMLEKIKAYDIYVGTDHAAFAREFKKLFK